MKKEIEPINATPSKRLFLSIIADYDLNKSICELIDNGLDAWVRGGRARRISISVLLDINQQIILVQDDAGGIVKSELRYIVGPGQTGTSPSDETIGLFGVGTKRAVVALSQDIRIKTRASGSKSYEVDIDETWLENEEWELPAYEIDAIPEHNTIVELQRLRRPLTDESIARLKDHLAATYAKFLGSSKVILKVNGDVIKPLFFENWAYPPGYHPQEYSAELKTAEGDNISFQAIAGLTTESSPAAGEYGVYFYCNDRLILRASKSFEVGFTKGLAGLPHPKVSLTRVIVSLNGDARSMPWNSSKSDINPNHEVFVALRNWLIQTVKDYASLSRIWMGDWPDSVFKYKTGSIKKIVIDDLPDVKKSYLPPLPMSKPRYGDKIAQMNREVTRKKPWAKGLYEGIIAVDLISRQRFEQKERIELILLDSTLEIAFKEYLVNESGHHYSDSQLLNLFKNRTDVQNEVKKYVKIRDETWKKINHFYGLRCKLVHERATVGLHENQINSFREIVESVLKKLFKLRFDKE